jgi:WD40 repeat protein
MVAVLRDGRWDTEVEREFKRPIECIALSSDGTLVAVAQENRIVIWNRQTQNEEGIIEAQDDTHSLLFVPNSDMLAAAHSGRSARDKAGVRIWDIVLGRVISDYEHGGVSWSRCSLDTDRLGRTLATGAFDGKLTIWALPTFNIIKEIDGLGGYAVAYSTDGTTIAAGCCSHSETQEIVKLVLIDVASGKIRLSIDYFDLISSLVFSPDGHYVASAGWASGEVCIWDVDPASLMFGQCLKVLEVKMNCQGMQISGARGLEQEIEWRVERQERKGTLLEFFADGGAVLDEEQERILAKLRKRREAGGQRK